MNLYNDLLQKREALSVIGLGYVGMPIAVAFSKKVNVIGFDLNPRKIDLYRSGIDPTDEVGDSAIAECSVEFTSDEQRLRAAKFHIVAVPTPVNLDKRPTFRPSQARRKYSAAISQRAASLYTNRRFIRA